MENTETLNPIDSGPYPIPMETLDSIFPGKMGRVQLTRVAIRMRRPDLLKKPTNQELDSALASALRAALNDVARG